MNNWNVISNLESEIRYIYHELALKLNLSDSSFSILYALTETNKSLTQKELCDYLLYSKTTINSAVKKLISEELVILDESKKVSLTKKGNEIKRKYISKIINDEKKALNKIDDKEFEIVNKVASNYLNELKESFSKYKEAK